MWKREIVEDKVFGPADEKQGDFLVVLSVGTDRYRSWENKRLGRPLEEEGNSLALCGGRLRSLQGGGVNRVCVVWSWGRQERKRG